MEEERSRLPESVQRLVAQRIDSVEMLQVLLALYDDSGRTWTAAQAAQAASLDSVAATRQLVLLRQRGFLTVEMADDAAYRYGPPEEVRDAVDDLVKCYRARPLEVLSLIAARPLRRLRMFADAFRLRRED
jgi:hypothetical protein